MADSPAKEDGGSSSPLHLSFLKLEDSPPSFSYFDPIKEWLLDSDSHPHRPMTTSSSDTPLIQPPLDCNLVPESLNESMPAATGQSREDSQEKPGEVDGLNDACGGEGLKNGADLSVKIEFSGDGRPGEESDASEDGSSKGSTSCSESESSSSSSSSSSSDDDEDDVGGGSGDEEDDKTKGKECGDEAEEGEIKIDEVEEMFLSSEDEDGGAVKGPIKSKNELPDLPPVPHVDVNLGPHHHTLPVGVISSIIGSQVIVEGAAKHNPLNEGSILWITETRSPLGLVDEIFGPVKNPYYVVRYNSSDEVPVGIHQGTAVSYVAEFCSPILNQNELLKKGYDASGENDEEMGDEIEFSDDEKEAEYKKSLKQPKRAMANQRNFNQDSVHKKKNWFKDRECRKDVLRNPPSTTVGRTNSAPCIPAAQCQLPSISSCNEFQGVPYGFVNFCCGATPTVPVMPQAVQPNFIFGGPPQSPWQQQSNTMWMPRPPIQQQNIALPIGFEITNPINPQQLHQSQHQNLQQQQSFPGFSNGPPTGIPFQQNQHQNAPYQGVQLNPALLNAQLSTSVGPVPVRSAFIANFSQFPFVSNNNINTDLRRSAINNDGQLFPQFASPTLPGNMHPPMQFNIGASSNFGGSGRPSFARPPFGRRHP